MVLCSMANKMYTSIYMHQIFNMHIQTHSQCVVVFNFLFSKQAEVQQPKVEVKVIFVHFGALLHDPDSWVI